MTAFLHENGYDFESIPRVHLAEQRVLLEGATVLGDIRQRDLELSAGTATGAGRSPEVREERAGHKESIRQRLRAEG